MTRLEILLGIFIVLLVLILGFLAGWHANPPATGSEPASTTPTRLFYDVRASAGQVPA